MRYNELLALKWDDVSLDDRVIMISDQKNNKVNRIPMTKNVEEYLRNTEQNGEYVISKSDGTGYYNIRKLWNNLVKKCGLAGCTPHVLRHTFATEFVKSGADLLVVKGFGRWADLKMVMRYAHAAKSHRTRVIHLLDDKFLPGKEIDGHKLITNKKRPPPKAAIK